MQIIALPASISCVPEKASWSTTTWAKTGLACSESSLPTATGASNLETEGREIGVAVEVVLVLRSLEEPHDLVGHRREHHLDSHLADELREHDRRQDLVRHQARVVERERIEERGVDRFPDDGRSDRARPEPSTLGHDLHLREHEGVRELPA